MKKILTTITICCALYAGGAAAQSGNPDTATRNFIIKASIGNIQEVVIGKIAAQKGQRTDVKAFGNRMINDHGQAQQKLMQLANAGGYQIPPNATATPVPDPMLQKAPAKDFDRLYVHMMVPDHRNTIELFQHYAIAGKDPQIRAFVKQTLPILKQHLAAITAIDQAIKNQAAK